MPERSQIIVVLLHHPTISLRAGNLAVASSGTWISLHRRDRSAIQGRSTGSTSAISSGKSGAQACFGQKADARRSALIVSRRLTIAGREKDARGITETEITVETTRLGCLTVIGESELIRCAGVRANLHANRHASREFSVSVEFIDLTCRGLPDYSIALPRAFTRAPIFFPRDGKTLTFLLSLERSA